MEICKYIIQKLLQHNVDQYKIIENTQKGISYKEIFNKTECETTLTAEIFVLFKIQDKFATFTVASDTCSKLIDIIIEKSIRHACLLNFKINDINKIKSLENSLKMESKFNTFKSDYYLKQIPAEIEKVRKSTLLNLNTVLNINIQKHRLLTNNKEFTQYYFSSECVCLENTTFSKNAILHNFSSINNLSDRIISKLNQQINLPYKEADCSIILIKDIAVSQILNFFIKQFYADNVYFGNSIIDKTQINKRIFNNNIFLESLPYNGINFDGEGLCVNDKFLLKDGQLVDLLSNIKFASYLNLNSAGNADFTSKKVTHQVLKFYTLNKTNLENVQPTLIIDNIKSTNIDTKNKTFTIITDCHDDNKGYCTSLIFDIQKFFNSLFSTSENFKLVDNTYCHNMIYVNKT